jgi:hypothetical protein
MCPITVRRLTSHPTRATPRARLAMMHLLGLTGLCALCMATAGATPAQLPPLPQDQVAAGSDELWLAVSHSQLDTLRGGFNLGEGLMVSFGISRVAYINDQLVASTTLQLGDITRLSARQAALLGQQVALQPQIIQNGPGNAVQPGAVTSPLTTVVQNSLNDQVLRTQTIINVSSNGLGALRNMNLQATINNALTSALGRR